MTDSDFAVVSVVLLTAWNFNMWLRMVQLRKRTKYLHHKLVELHEFTVALSERHELESVKPHPDIKNFSN